MSAVKGFLPGALIVVAVFAGSFGVQHVMAKRARDTQVDAIRQDVIAHLDQTSPPSPLLGRWVGSQKEFEFLADGSFHESLAISVSDTSDGLLYAYSPHVVMRGEWVVSNDTLRRTVKEIVDAQIHDLNISSYDYALAHGQAAADQAAAELEQRLRTNILPTFRSRIVGSVFVDALTFRGDTLWLTEGGGTTQLVRGS